MSVLKTTGLLTVIAGLATMQVQAATIQWTNTVGVGEWNDAGNWDLGVPGSGDDVRLVQSTDNAQVTSAFDGGNMTITMRNGASLAVSANFRTAYVLNLGISGVTDVGLTQTDGLLIGRTLNLGNDAEADVFDAKYTISGGTARWTTAVTIGKNGIFEIDGNGGVIQFNNGGSSAVTLGDGMLSYKLAANGVSAIDNLSSGGTFTIGANSKLQIDASAYTGGEGTIQLVRRYASISGTFDTNNVSITGLAEGLSGEITYDATGVYLDVIPEPAAIGMVVMVSVSALFIRRRLQMG